MLETNEEDDEDNDTENDKNSRALTLYEEDNSKLNEAQQLLARIIKQKEALELGLPFPTEPDEQLYIESEQRSLILDENKVLDKQENSLKKQLQEQEDNLANLMKEIEAIAIE